MSDTTIAPAAGPHQTQLLEYFDGIGFERWSAIYGEAALSPIRRSIRTGHMRMLHTATAWLTEQQPTGHVLDAGCGVGLFSVDMARRGYQVTAVDIAPRMVAATALAADAAGVAGQVTLGVGDVGSIRGRFDAVACFDVLVHYPQPAFITLCRHLARLTDGQLLMTYAPYNRLFAALLQLDRGKNARHAGADYGVAQSTGGTGVFCHLSSTLVIMHSG